jgi:hypothetical protein
LRLSESEMDLNIAIANLGIAADKSDLKHHG